MKKTRLIVLLACTFLISWNGTAQTVSTKLSEALQTTLDSMHIVLGIYGMGAALQLPNGAVWAGGAGISTQNPWEEIGPQHAFETGSTSKTITAACILQLADEGILSLNDSLHQWLPDFNHINPNITISQLLRHQSGIFDILMNPSFNAAMSQNINQIWSLEDAVSTFINAPVFQPGESWGYSNTNYILLGMIIETATGKPFHIEIEDRFFTSLGLDSYANPAFSALPDPSSHLWLDLNGDGVLDDAFNFLTSRKSMFSCIGPAGGYFATPSDLAKWIRASMSGSLFSVDTWTTASTTIPTPNGTNYGLGLTERIFQGFTGFGHGGDLAGYSTQSFYFPEKDISIAVCSNDASIVSWNLTNTVIALLNTYIECEDEATSVTEVDKEAISVSISPNPFIEKLSLTVDLQKNIEELNLTLTNINGQQVWSSTLELNGRTEVETSIENLNHLSSGTYLMHLKAGESGKIVKIIKF